MKRHADNIEVLLIDLWNLTAEALENVRFPAGSSLAEYHEDMKEARTKFKQILKHHGYTLNGRHKPAR